MQANVDFGWRRLGGRVLLLQLAVALTACAGGPPPILEKLQAFSEPFMAQRSSEPAKPLRTQLASNGPVAEVVPPALDLEAQVFFASGESRVEAEEQLKVLLHAARLKADPKLCVTLVGHTDDLGSPAYNLAIAQQRVDAVYDLLRSQGVARNQIRRYPVGSEKMPAGCRSEACRSRMRRVEFDYGR